jgi:flagellar protein FlgJ
MISSRPITASTDTLATGTASLDTLRAAAGKDPKGAIREAAKQFESLFMQQLLKSMRDTTLSSGMLENQGTEMGTSMLDSQYATQLAGRPGGLADAIARQLERQMGFTADEAAGPARLNTLSVARARASALTAQPAVSDAPVAPAAAAAPASAQNFVQANTAAAERVAAQSGIPAAFMLGQAAHETGWGKRAIRDDQGRDSHNLFGIKAGANWTGPVAEATTTEVINGQAVKVKARFRAYASAEESFRDYAQLIGNSPRYAGVMQARGDAQSFAQNLQKAGYATDPQYADKLGRVINTTLRLQRLTT